MSASIPFGRCRGQLLADLPDDYLPSLSTIDLRPGLAAAVSNEIRARREARTRSQRPAALPPADPTVACELIDAGRRALARRHHADAGGDPARMARVNDTADQLSAWLAGAA